MSAFEEWLRDIPLPMVSLPHLEKLLREAWEAGAASEAETGEQQ